MEFDVRARSPDMRQSVYAFPNDERYTPIEYATTMFNGYISSVATITGAAHGLGVSIDPETFERWKRIAVAAGLLDDFLDTPHDTEDAHQFYNASLSVPLAVHDSPQAPGWANAQLEPAVRLLTNSILGLEQAAQTRLIQAAHAIGDIALHKAQCEDVRMYVDLLKEEALETSRLICLSASPTVQNMPGFDGLAEWCRTAMRLGTFADHTWDLWSDHAAKRTAVAVTMSNSLHIARNTLQPAWYMLMQADNRRATLRALSARLRYSPLPTQIALRLHRNKK
jgi:hypothetical protein